MNNPLKQFNGPTRFSSRKQIFSNREKQSTSKKLQINESMKLEAKMREISEDISILRSKNQKLQNNNNELLTSISEIQHTLNQQNHFIEALNQKILRESRQNNQMDDYQSNLKIVGQKINSLNDTIRQRNQEYGQLAIQKKRLQGQRKRLKEQYNNFLYNQNLYHEEINQLLIENECLQQEQPLDQFSHDQQKQEEQNLLYDFSNKIIKVLKAYQCIKQKAEEKRRQVQIVRKGIKQAVGIEKQKKIELQYKLKLLKQRRADQEKKKQFYKSSYDESKVQDVINQMLVKQDQIRYEIQTMAGKLKIFKSQQDESLTKNIKRLNKSREERPFQINLIKSQNQRLTKNLNQVKIQCNQISIKISKKQTQYSLKTKKQKQNNELIEKIKGLQEQNINLQMQYSNLNVQVELLQKQLIY